MQNQIKEILMTPDELQRVRDEEQSNAPMEPTIGPQTDLSQYGPMRGLYESMAMTPKDKEVALAQVKEMLPTVAAGAASMFPPIAALGGLTGLATRAALSGVAAGATGAALGQTPKDAAMTGLTEAATSGVGDVVGAAVNLPAARKNIVQMYESVLKASNPLKREFGDIAKTLVDDKLPINDASFDFVQNDITRLRKDADSLIDQAALRLRSQPRGTIGLNDVLTQVSLDPNNAKRVKTATDQIAQLKATLSRGMDIKMANELKRQLQKQADSAYAQVRSGNRSQLSVKNLMDMAVARDLKVALENRVGPSLKNTNDAIVRRIGQARALSDAIMRIDKHMPFGSVSDIAAFTTAMATGSPAAGIAAKLISYPATSQAAAIGASRVADVMSTTPLLRQMSQAQTPVTAQLLRIGNIVRIGNKNVLVTKVKENGEIDGVVLEK
jgi:hypothetical protein